MARSLAASDVNLKEEPPLRQHYQGPTSETTMKVDTEVIKVLSQQADLLKQQLAVCEKEYIDLYMREKALQRMVSQANARYTAMSAAHAGQSTSSCPATCLSKDLQAVFEEHVPSSSMMRCIGTTGIDAIAGAQDLSVRGLATEPHIAYIRRASVLLIRMGTYAARPGDLADLEELTRCHWATIVKTGMASIQTLWKYHALNFETGEVEEAPDELFPDVLSKVALTQEQMFTLSAGAQNS